MSTHAMPHPERRRTERRKEAGISSHQQSGQHTMKMGSYGRFWAMVATSTAIADSTMVTPFT